MQNNGKRFFNRRKELFPKIKKRRPMSLRFLQFRAIQAWMSVSVPRTVVSGFVN
jgi:hypothetical protein